MYVLSGVNILPKASIFSRNFFAGKVCLRRNYDATEEKAFSVEKLSRVHSTYKYISTALQQQIQIALKDNHFTQKTHSQFNSW